MTVPLLCKGCRRVKKLDILTGLCGDCISKAAIIPDMPLGPGEQPQPVRITHTNDSPYPIRIHREVKGSEIIFTIRAVPPREVKEGENPHLIDGEFQSDKYPMCPKGKVPLSTKDPAAQDLLWWYARRRRAGSHGSKETDPSFADAVEHAIAKHGFDPTETLARIDTIRDLYEQASNAGLVHCDAHEAPMTDCPLCMTLLFDSIAEVRRAAESYFKHALWRLEG